ncbi:MAG TPA: tetratricopeptide repeat protein [Nitrospiria bacterium]
MAYKIRVATSKEQLKKPDEFIGTVDWLGDKIQEHSKLAWMIVGIVLLVGAGIGAAWFYQEQQKNRAASLEYEGLRYYRQQAPADDKGAAPPKEENYKKAVEQFQKVLQEFPRTPSASIAQFYIGNAHMELNDFDSAISAYRAFLEKKPKNDILAGMAYQRLGYAYLAKNSPEEARQAFESVNRLAGAINKDQVSYELGRMDETSGKKDEGIKRYQEIVSRYPDSLFLAEAQRRLSALGVTEVKPVQVNPSVSVSPAEKPITVVPAPNQNPVPGDAPIPMEKK